MTKCKWCGKYHSTGTPLCSACRGRGIHMLLGILAVVALIVGGLLM